MKVADKSSDIVVKRPQPWNVFGRLDALESRLDAIETSISRLDALVKMDQKMTAIMFIATQVPVWEMLLKK